MARIGAPTLFVNQLVQVDSKWQTGARDGFEFQKCIEPEKSADIKSFARLCNHTQQDVKFCSRTGVQNLQLLLVTLRQEQNTSPIIMMSYRELMLLICKQMLM